MASTPKVAAQALYQPHALWAVIWNDKTPPQRPPPATQANPRKRHAPIPRPNYPALQLNFYKPAAELPILLRAALSHTQLEPNMRPNYLALVQLAPNPAAELPRFALDFPNSAIELFHLPAELPAPQPGSTRLI